MKRGEFLKMAAMATASGWLAGRSPQQDLSLTTAVFRKNWCRPSLFLAQEQQSILAPARSQEIAATNFTLRIAPVTVELARNRVISTIGYNGISPGPRLRMKEGVPVRLTVVNDTDVPETVHCHGLLIPPEVDGSEEEGTPVVPPHGSRSYTFTPAPAGTRWYHTHAMSMDDLHRGTYTGMFGFLVIEGRDNPGNFDQEHYLALRDWEPYFTSTPMDNDDLDAPGPQPERPAVMDTRTPGLEVMADVYSINDKALGAGEPIRAGRARDVPLPKCERD